MTKKFFPLQQTQVKDFHDSNLAEKVVHLLANTLVAIPFMHWDVDVVRHQHSPFENGRKPARSMSYPPSLDRPEARPDKTKSMIEPKRDKKTNGANGNNGGFNLMNIFSPLMAEVGDLNQNIIDLWWKDPRRKLSEDEAIELLPKTLEQMPREDKSEA